MEVKEIENFLQKTCFLEVKVFVIVIGYHYVFLRVCSQRPVLVGTNYRDELLFSGLK